MKRKKKKFSFSNPSRFALLLQAEKTPVKRLVVVVVVVLLLLRKRFFSL